MWREIKNEQGQTEKQDRKYNGGLQPLTAVTCKHMDHQFKLRWEASEVSEEHSDVMNHENNWKAQKILNDIILN